MRTFTLTGRALTLVVAAALCACAGAKRASKNDSAAKPASTDEPRIAGSEYGSTPELKPIRFDYDRDELTPAARAVLKANAAAIKENAGWEVLVEGHCDERGTSAYNLALGQRRAKAVRDYYMALGVHGGRVATISFGEERLECQDGTDACHARNRRGLSKVKTAVAGKPVGGPARHE